MIIFSIYALVIWWAAYHGRRTWRGFAAALGGGSFVLPAIDPLVYVAWLLAGERPTWLFVFFYAYAGVLVLVGLMLAVLPRRDEVHPCDACGYELAGIDARVCPECGGRLSRSAQNAGRRASAPRPAPPR